MTQRRAAMAWMLAACGAAWVGPAPAAEGPQRNLLVSWRVVSSGTSLRQNQGLRRGEVIIDSRRGVLGRGGVEWSSQEVRHGQRAQQQVLVLNGGQARVDLREQWPETQWQWMVQTPSFGSPEQSVGLVGQTVWMDSGLGLAVRPRWPGGRAPVTVTLEAEAPLRAEGGDDRHPPGRLIAQTTLNVPLDEWMAVARTQQQTGQSQRGLWQTDRRHEDQAVLEIHISAP